MGNNNRARGNSFELDVIKDMKEVGFSRAVSSRAESRNRDAAGVDICYTDPYNIQCKNYVKRINYDEILESMPVEGVNVIVHKYTEKKGNRFYEKGRFVMMNYKDFLEILKDKKRLNELLQKQSNQSE